MKQDKKVKLRRVGFRCNEEDYKEILRRMKETGYDIVSKYMRDAVVKGKILDIDPRPLLECSMKLGQLLSAVEKGAYPGEVIDKVGEAIELLAKVEEGILKILD